MRRLLTFVLSLSLVLSLAAIPARADTTETTVATEVTTEPTTAPTTEASTVPETEATTESETQPATEESTEATTEPETEPSTEPTTEATTEPATEPGTVDVQAQVGSLSVTVHDVPAGAVLEAQELPDPLSEEAFPNLEILFQGRFHLNLYLDEEKLDLGPVTVTVEGLPDGGEFLVTQESGMLTRHNGGLQVENGAISFQMDSPSWFSIKQYRLLHSRPVIPDIESDKPEDRMVLNKFVTEEEDGSLSLYLEAYATGYLKPKPTEIVLVMDHSGSMYSAMSSDRFYNYEDFLASHPTGSGNETYPGYYLCMTKNSKTEAGHQSHAAALVWWNGSSWVRSQQVEISEHEYLTRKTGFTYPDSKIRETASLKGYNYDGPDAVYFKTVAGAAMDGLGAFLKEIEGLPGCKVAVTGFASPEYKIRQGYSDADGLWESEETSHANSQNPHRMGGTGVYIDGSLQVDGGDYSQAFLKADDPREFDKLSQTIRGIKTCYWNTVTESGLRNANEIFNASSEENPSRIVVLFTDGKPDSTSGGTGNPEQAAISAAETVKKNGAQVYVFGPADLSSTPGAADLLDKLSSNDGGENRYLGFADDAESLERFFAQLGQKIVYDNFLMGPDTVARDVISDGFTLNGTPQAWIVPVIRKGGMILFDNDPSSWQALEGDISVDGQTISVKGFDYRAHLIPAGQDGGEGQPTGAKLVVKIPIAPAQSYRGDGENVPTNGSGSGLFDKDGNLVNSFREPAVDLRTTVTVKKTVEGRDLGEAFGFHAEYTKADRYEDTGGTLAQTLDAGGNSFGGNHLDAVTEPAESSFKLKHGGIWQAKNAKVGSTFTVREAENSLYHVTVLVNGTEIGPDNGVTVTPNMTVEFINTSRLADLTIVKQGADPRDENQTFLFRIQGLDDENCHVNRTVTILGNGSITVKDLPVGTYRVTEDEAWSWRYEAVSMEAAGKRYPGSSVELKLTAAGETVTCTNRRREEKWLDGNSYCQNLFKETGVERRAEK